MFPRVSTPSARFLPSAGRIGVLALSTIMLLAALTSPVIAQVSPEEHAKHHPEEAGGGSKPGGMGGMMGGMMGEGMGGMMDSMMEKMGAPKPKEMYPRLMDLPDLPMEERMQIGADAHQRMVDGAALMSGGFDRLAAAAPGDDFAAMQSATASIREGLAQFESGLAAHRAIREGKSPRNVALQWFRREMNLLPPATTAQAGLFGMSTFHFSVMVLLIVFSAAVIWMYFFKMRRATALLQRLAVAAPESAPTATVPASSDRSPLALARNRSAQSNRSVGASNKDDHSCCDDSAEASGTACADDMDADAPTITGLLPMRKRKLCRLRVSRIFEETADVKTFRLVACHNGGIPFSYLPGQFLTLTLPVGDKPIRRSYTMSSSPTQGYYCEITVKREEQGAGSRYLHDVLAEGDTLEVQAPSGKFTFTGHEADSVVLIAGGVGITPMMSITRALTDMGWTGDIHFVIACRDPQHLIFADELQRLQQRHSNLHVHVAMSRIEQDINGYTAGRLTQERLAEWVPDIAEQRIHLCGAPAMMDSVNQMLAELQVAPDQIHTEDFGSQRKPHLKAAAREEAGTTSAEPQAATVSFTASARTTEFLPDETVLDAAERVGVDIESSCRVGSCGVCTVKLLSGEVSMDCDDGLEDDDRAAGMILACQAVPNGDIQIES